MSAFVTSIQFANSKTFNVSVVDKTAKIAWPLVAPSAYTVNGYHYGIFLERNKPGLTINIKII